MCGCEHVECSLLGEYVALCCGVVPPWQYLLMYVLIVCGGSEIPKSSVCRTSHYNGFRLSVLVKAMHHD